MNFRFLNAYESNIKPLLFGVAFDEYQRKKAIDAIMLVGKKYNRHQQQRFCENRPVQIPRIRKRCAS